MERAQAPEERPFEPSDLIRMSHDRLDPAGVYLMGACGARGHRLGTVPAGSNSTAFLTLPAHEEWRWRLDGQRTACS